MSASRFRGELRATAPASALTDGLGKSDGQPRRSLSPQARLASASCAMFSEGWRHSAVAQVDRQMVHVAARHERDWQSGGGIPGWSPARLKSERVLAAVAWRLGFNRATTRGHQPRHTSKVPSIRLEGGWGGPSSSSSVHMKALFRGSL